MGITLYWTLYFLLICLITLAMHKDIAFVVALFTVYGLTMYGVDKKNHFSIVRRSVLIAVGALLFAIIAAIV
jgi:hypothetical protein